METKKHDFESAHSEENLSSKGLSVLIQSLVSLPPFLTIFFFTKDQLRPFKVLKIVWKYLQSVSMHGTSL